MNESSPKKMKQTMLQECLHMLQNLEYCATPEESSGWECPMCDASHVFLKHKSDCRLWDLISRVDKAVSNKENVISPQKMKCKCIPIPAEGMWDLRMDPTNCSIPSHQPLELTWEKNALEALEGCPDPKTFVDRVRHWKFHEPKCKAWENTLGRGCDCMLSWLKDKS